MATTEPVVCAR